MNRIMYVISSLNIGGAEVQLLRTIEVLDRDRFQPEVCSLQNDGPLAETFRALGVPVYCLNRRSKIDFRLPFRFFQLIRRRRPDILHTHMLYASFLARPLAVIFPKMKLICHDHGLGTWKSPLLCRFDCWTSWPIDMRIAVSDCSRQLRLRREQLNPNKLMVVYNGVDANAFDPSRFSTAKWTGEGVLKLVSIGTLKPVKGIRYLVRALAQLTGQDIDIHLDLIGDGPERLELERLASELGVSQRVSFCGRCTDVPNLLSRAHVFVMPSDREDMPLALLEAMAMERPCVASRVGGIPEALEHGRTGWLFNVGDVMQLSNLLRYLYTHPSEAVQVGRQARQRIIDMFTIDLQVHALQDVYDKLK